ncbi:MAG: hypothetical protein AAGB22_12690, partial [Bacteroidota bacterium]
MKKFLTGFLGLICILGTSLEAQQVQHGTAAAAIVPGASMVRMQPFSAVPNYIRFQEGKEPAAQELETILRAFMAAPEDFSLQLIGTETDRLGQVHYRYQQVYRGIPVAMGTYIAHTRNGQLLSANGELFDQLEAAAPILTEAQ